VILELIACVGVQRIVSAAAATRDAFKAHREDQSMIRDGEYSLRWIIF